MRHRFLSTLLCTVAATAVSISLAQPALAQGGGAQKAPLSPLAKAEVSLTDAQISIDYSAPSMRGRQIFGDGTLVPYGKVWRTGANSATTLKTSGNLMIGSLSVPAGTYTIYSLPTAEGWKLIVNKQTGQWGTVYKEDMDLGRVPMEKASNASSVEKMVIDFENTSGDSTELHVKWADVDASVKVTASK
ncbi:DUF2911 domain-containing protein [Acidicapsa dinghuensis]|uniref:DUF2911 domain-containing protein n=1 Tax=Acidicapsa dinghuensis TaxID=2218256 RepID=A0ABW1EDL4_9BACT|nr:DUF2911 domain-containing protein [Acidicapsa dinghuensis]